MLLTRSPLALTVITLFTLAVLLATIGAPFEMGG